MFGFTRDISELELVKLIADYLEAKTYVRKLGDRVDINIAGLEQCINLITFFDRYPLQSIKHKEYLIWREYCLRAKNLRDIPFKFRGSLENYLPIFFQLTEKLYKFRKGS